jgi:predicted CoA-binding protein
MATVAHQFIKSPYFAVVGASTNREKFGNRVLRWYVSLYTRYVYMEKLLKRSFTLLRYQSNGLDITPINPVCYITNKCRHTYLIHIL